MDIENVSFAGDSRVIAYVDSQFSYLDFCDRAVKVYFRGLKKIVRLVRFL